MSDKPKAPYRDPKYSGWPGPEPVQTDIEEAIVEAPKPKKKKPILEDASE
jgi:hypothetical protein